MIHVDRISLRYAFLLPVIALLLNTVPLHSQPNLNFKRVTVNWPTIELYVSVGCNGNPAYNMTKQDFRIFENGAEVTNFTITCPDPTLRAALSVALVFDASGSMTGAGQAGAKQAGHAFVDMMDGLIDEAAVLWFSSVVTIQQQMTTNKPMLHSAVDNIPAGGATAVWDGGYAGLLEIINNGTNPNRGVILLTDGGDNSSTRQPAEIIALANREKIRVFTIGLGSSINSVELELIAQLTGGKYYQTPNAGQLSAIYQEISTILFQSFQECVITYDRGCADGMLRTVELSLNNFCGGSDTKTKTYRAPLDSATFSGLQLGIGDAGTIGGGDVTVPLQLLTNLSSQQLAPMSFIITFDNSCLQFNSVTVPSGSLLQGVPMTVTPLPIGIHVQTNAAKVINGNGLLMNLTFRAPSRTDTACCAVEINDIQFESGCFLPIVAPGEICVYPLPDGPFVNCDMDWPSTISWDRTLKEYTPNPIVISSRAYNSGTLAARNSLHTISYDTSAFVLVSPTTLTQPGTPVDVAPGQFSVAVWEFRAKPRVVADSSIICVDLSFDNHKTIDCCTRLFIPAVTSDLSCALQIPAIQIDTAAQDYSPMPFGITITATNTGLVPTDTVWATISFQPELEFSSPDTPGTATKLLSLPVLQPQQSGTATWMLWHPEALTDRNYTVSVTVRAGSDVSVCNGNVMIPAMPGTYFPIKISTSGPLTICEGQSVSLDAGTGYTSYRWNNGWVSRRQTVYSSGSYYCVVKAADGSTGISDTVQVVVAQNPKPDITVTGPIPFCEGQSAFLFAGAGYTRYLWSTGSDRNLLEAKTAGEYIVTVWNDEGCAGSDTVVVTVFPPVPRPLISRRGDSLTASIEGMSYAWSREGSPISGATGQSIYVTQTGSYSVRITDGNGCTADSDPFAVTVLDATPPPVAGAFQLLAYPDPADDVLTIQLKDVGTEQLRVILSDAVGRSETVFAGRATDAGLTLSVPLQSWSRGALFIQAWHGGNVVVKKIMRM